MPLCKSHIENRGTEYPFSYIHFVCSAIQACSGSGKCQEMIAQQVLFLKMYEGVKFDQTLVKEYGLDGLICYSSEPEEGEAIISEELKNSLHEVLNDTTSKPLEGYQIR